MTKNKQATPTFGIGGLLAIGEFEELELGLEVLLLLVRGGHEERHADPVRRELTRAVDANGALQVRPAQHHHLGALVGVLWRQPAAQFKLYYTWFYVVDC